MKYRITKYSLFLLDIAIVLFSFFFVAKLRTGTKVVIALYGRSVVPFTLIWILTGVWGLKYSIKSMATGMDLLKRIIKCDVIAVLLVFTAILIGKLHYLRGLVFGTILGSFSLEVFLFMGIYYAFRFTLDNRPFASTKMVTSSRALEEAQNPLFFPKPIQAIPAISNSAYIPPFSPDIEANAVIVPLWERYLAGYSDLFSFINDYVDLTRFSKDETLVLNSETYYNIQIISENSLQIFINLRKINDLRRLNQYFVRVNEMLKPGGVFVCSGQTVLEKREDLYHRFTPFLGSIIYFFDFLFKRVCPKLPILQGWYFAITKGKNRALSETEMLGRFYYCGFELIHKREIDGHMHFILKKTAPPKTDPNPTYGPFIRLKRKGQGGKIIYVKKFRTMHPYSEYLQDYVYQTNALQEGGKFRDDFRVTSWGKILRKLWIDELPQFLNFFRGELSIVGVRALSEHYFSLYPPDMQELRLKVKPGLLPPFYADMPKTFDEIVESERRYITAKLERPFATDCRYFFKAAWNILVKKARSF